MVTSGIDTSTIAGAQLGTIERRYGLMSSRETIVIREVIAVSGDLAVSDRLAFLAASERHEAVAVVEHEGWFVACTTDRALVAADLRVLEPCQGAPRVMSLVTVRGITPSLGPMVA